jgi:peptidoglycan biosynthesis protein MviN/MurJ (putative lipid II flippase)
MLGAMAVRAFDITDVSTASVTLLEHAPRTRRDERRNRQRHAILGITFLTVPFVVALVVLGVGH